MLVIQRTEEGRLRLADRRRAGTAEGEAEARRTLYHWGYTDLSINKALAEMRRSEGTLPAVAPWRVIRPTDAASEIAANRPEGGAEDPAGTEPKEIVVKTSRKKRERTAAPEDRSPGSTAPAPEPASAHTAGESPSPAPGRRTRRTSRAERSDAAGSEAAAPTSSAVAEPPAGEAEVPEPAASRPTRRKSARRATAPAESEPVPEAPAEAQPEAAKRSRAGTRKKPARAAPTSDVPAEAGIEVAPTSEAADRRETRVPAPIEPERAVPAPASEAVESTRATSARRSRGRAPAPEPAAAAASPAPEADPLAHARTLFADGARALRQLESNTLPFARGPWTELREQAEHILGCLQGKQPNRS